MVVDAHSGWEEVTLLISMTSAKVVELLQLLICRYGIPECIVTDNGTFFTSNEFHDCCRPKHLGIKHDTTPVAHQSSYVQVKCVCVQWRVLKKKLCTELSHKGLEADLDQL